MTSQVTDPVEELVFLRQMVQRLNSALAKHQGTDHSLLDAEASIDPPAPWLTNPQHLAPLLNEYDTHLTHLVSQVTKIKDENHERKLRLQSVSEENQRLHAELQEIVQQQMKEADYTDHPQGQGNEMLENLQRQVELASAEKEDAVRMCRDTMQQLDKLRHQRQTESASVKSCLQSYDDTRKLNEQLQDANLNLQMSLDAIRNENQALTSALHQQENDLQETRENLKVTKTEFHKNKVELGEKNQRIETLTVQLEALQSDNGEKHRRQLATQNVTEKLQQELTDAEGKLAQALQDRTNAVSEIDSLKIEIVALEKMNKEMEQKELNNLEQIREHTQMVENALLARDSAMERERNKQEEVDRIRVAMETLVEEAAERVKNEVNRVKGQYNSNIQRLMEEMQSTELENHNLRSDADRSKRAKRAVEEEFDKYQQQQRESFSNRKWEDIHARMLIAERAKDDALVTVQSLEDKIKRIKIERENDTISWVSKHESLERNVKQLKRDLDESQHQRMLLMETINRYKNEAQKFETTANEVKLECSRETAQVKSQAERERKQLKTRVRSLEDSNRNGIQHLHKMLADQQRMTAKWKEEYQSISGKYESKISELQNQLSRTKKRCAELTNKLQQMKNQHTEISSQVPDLSETNRKLRARLHETEYRLISATERLGEMQGRKTALTLKDLES
ncbi:sodium channel and clathrin linker 1-like [Styela clava]